MNELCAIKLVVEVGEGGIIRSADRDAERSDVSTKGLTTYGELARTGVVEVGTTLGNTNNGGKFCDDRKAEVVFTEVVRELVCKG